VIHNYRRRQGLAQGDPWFDDLEQALSAMLTIEVSTITIVSDFDGPNADGARYVKQLPGKLLAPHPRGHRPRCAARGAEALTDAILEVDRY
jgi:hypothetical protein